MSFNIRYPRDLTPFVNYNEEIEPQNAIANATEIVSPAIDELVQNIEMPSTPNNNTVIAGDDAAANHSYDDLPGINGDRPEVTSSLSQIIHDGLPAPDAWAKQMFASPPQRTTNSEYGFAVVPTSPSWHEYPSQPYSPREWYNGGIFSPVYNPSLRYLGSPYFYDHHSSQPESPHPASAAFLISPENNDSDQMEFTHPRPLRIISSEQLEGVADLLSLPDGSLAQIQQLEAENSRLQRVAVESAKNLNDRGQRLMVALNEQRQLLLDSYQNEEVRELLQAELKQQTLENSRLQKNAANYHGEPLELRKLHEAAIDDYRQLQLGHQQSAIKSLKIKQEGDEFQPRLAQQTLKNAIHRQDMEQAYRRRMSEPDVYTHASEVYRGHLGGEFEQLQIERDGLEAQRDVCLQQIEERDTEIRRIREEAESAVTAMIDRQVKRHASNRDLVVHLRTKIERERQASDEKNNEIRALTARVQEIEDALEKEHQKVKLKTSQNRVLRIRYEVRGQQVRAYRQGVQQERKRQREEDKKREQKRDVKRQRGAHFTRYAE